MGWSDILGAVGGIAGAAGGLLSGGTGIWGDVGKIVGGIGTAANLGGQLVASNQSQGLQDTATAGQTQAMNAALRLSQQQSKREQESYDKAMSAVSDQRAAYDKTIAALGPADKAPVFDPNNIETRAQQLLPMYMTDADRRMEQMFSSDMGSLMGQGVDSSTGGIQARAALGAKSADVHRTAYNQAYQEALTYATSVYDEQLKSHGGITADRAAALKEAMDPYAAAYTDYAGLYGKGGTGNELGTAGTLADMLSKTAAVGSQAAATGAQSQATKQSFSDMLKGIKDIWGGTGTSSASSATDPFAYIGSGGTDTYTLASGRDY